MIFKLLSDRQSEFRESSEQIMYKLSYNMSTEKFQAVQKSFFIISMRMSVFLVKCDAYSWREIFSTREKLEKILKP